MGKTTFATNNALTKKVWEEQFFREVEAESVTTDWMSETKNSFIQVKTELTKVKGDQITFGIRNRLTGAGVVSGQILENNEERLSTSSFNVSLEQHRHAVRDDGAMSRQRAMFSIDDESEDALKVWGATKKDQLMLDALLAAPTKTLYRDGVTGAFSGTAVQATAKTALSTANSKITPNFISALRAWAKTGGSGAGYRLRPVSVSSSDIYGLVVNPAGLFDFKTDPIYQQAMRDAMDRGKSNPLFKSAVAVWDNVVIYESERVPLFVNGGSGSDVVGFHGILMGAQAGVWAWGKRPETHQDTFDYGNEHGFAWEMIAAAGKPKFDNGSGTTMDYGVIGVTLAATNVITV